MTQDELDAKRAALQLGLTVTIELEAIGRYRGQQWVAHLRKDGDEYLHQMEQLGPDGMKGGWLLTDIGALVHRSKRTWSPRSLDAIRILQLIPDDEKAVHT